MSKRRGSANKMNGAAASSRDTGLTLFDTTTCETSEPSRALSTQDTSTCSAEVSPARTCRTRGTVLASRANEAVCGESLRESFANFDRESSSWKTSQRSLLGGWTSFSENWPRSGMMLSGRVFELPTLGLPTDETDSSSSHGGQQWNTPTVEDAGRNGSPEWAKRWADGETIPETQQRLRTQALWPTPKVQDEKHTTISPSEAARNTPTLATAAMLSQRSECPTPGSLNPEWVGQLMGFPAGWTSPITDGPSAQENSKGSGKRLASRRSGTNDDND